MKDRLVARRYAEAYMEFAEPKIGRARCVEDMKNLRTVVRDTPDFLQFLQAPEISKDLKGSFLDRVLGEVLAEETRTFIKYLIEKGRVSSLIPVTNYIRIVFSHGDVVDVVLRTTFPLELDLIEQIKTKVALFACRKVNLYLELDPDLLGGAQIRIGNRIIDGSVRNRLIQLKKQLLQAKVVS